MKPATGPLIARLVEETEAALLVVAPYITRPAFQHLLTLIGDRPLAVVTEWSIRSVATGATDPRIYLDVAERQAHHQTQLSLLPGLHGKLYLCGERALVGSTNLTANGTGWFGQGNLELLVEVPADTPEVKAFVQAVREHRIEATAAHADAARRAAQDYQPPKPHSGTIDLPTPLLRSQPRQFFQEYLSGNISKDAVQQDLHTLNVPDGLAREQLIHHLQTHLRALAFYDLATTVSRRTGRTGDPHQQQEVFEQTAATYGIERPEPPEQAERHWTTLMEWMQLLFPKEFSTVSTGPRLLVSTVGHF